ncbi:unnamed protein product, partial [Effrenium voratum]
MRRESRLLAECAHPCVLQQYGLVEVSGQETELLTMELMEGSLADIATFNGCPCADVASALQFLHSRRIVHRDIKDLREDNILVTEVQPPFRCKLGDFGLATFLGPDRKLS